MPVGAQELLKGAIDMHLHIGPSNHRIPTLLDGVECAREAEAAGMRAVVFKEQFIATTDRAYFAAREAESIKVFGGTALNLYVGGLNKWAVQACIQAGGKVIWMPVSHSRHFLAQLDNLPYASGAKAIYPTPEEALTILDEEGNLLPELEDILLQIAEADIILNTGHLSPRESLALIPEAKRLGVRKIVVNHPLASAIGATLEQQEEMVSMGAYLEHTFGKTLPRMEQLDPRKIAESMKLVGAENCVMSTDTGFVNYPRPVESMRMYIEIMRWAGMKDEEIEIMIKHNPAQLLGLN